MIPAKKPTRKLKSSGHPIPHISTDRYPPNLSYQIPQTWVEGPKLFEPEWQPRKAWFISGDEEWAVVKSDNQKMLNLIS